MFPILCIFDNLKFLKLASCNIPFIRFSNLSESLFNLEAMELIYVTFVKLSSDNNSNSRFKFPQNLNSLKIFNCTTCTESVLSPEEFLFNDGELVIVTGFLLPEYSMPSLKELEFFSNYEHDSVIKDFIELNPELESLTMKSRNLNYISLNSIKSLTNLKSLEIRGSINLNPETQIPTLEYIKSLKFDVIIDGKYVIVAKLILSCPNLSKLHFKTFANMDFQNEIDNDITQLFNNCPNIKLFRLNIITNRFRKIKFSKFYWLETLVIESMQLDPIDIDFESCSSLREVILKSIPIINTNEFKNKFNNIEGWKFKFSSDIIKGHKIL
jgi:hypothetical protein